MKINTYISRILYSLLLITLLNSCKKEEQPNKPAPSAFSATSAAAANTVPAAGATLNISIAGGSNGWAIVVPEAAKSWCTITRVFGSGNVEVPVVIKKNETGAERMVEVSINPTFNLAPVKIVFKQAGT